MCVSSDWIKQECKAKLGEDRLGQAVIAKALICFSVAAAADAAAATAVLDRHHHCQPPSPFPSHPPRPTTTTCVNVNTQTQNIYRWDKCKYCNWQESVQSAGGLHLINMQYWGRLHSDTKIWNSNWLTEINIGRLVYWLAGVLGRWISFKKILVWCSSDILSLKQLFFCQQIKC